MARLTNSAKAVQSGAVLVVGLVLLATVTLLAATSARTAVSELRIARSHQTHELLFQAAETGLEQLLAATMFDTAGPAISSATIDSQTFLQLRVEYVGQTDVPDEAFRSISIGGVSAYHFTATATATLQPNLSTNTAYNISTAHSQSFYVVGPTSAAAPPPAITVRTSSESMVCVGADCLDTSFDPSPIRTAWRVEDSP